MREGGKAHQPTPARANGPKAVQRPASGSAYRAAAREKPFVTQLPPEKRSKVTFGAADGVGKGNRRVGKPGFQPYGETRWRCLGEVDSACSTLGAQRGQEVVS